MLDKLEEVEKRYEELNTLIGILRGDNNDSERDV